MCRYNKTSPPLVSSNGPPGILMLASTPFDDAKPLKLFCVGKSTLVTAECGEFDIAWEWSTVGNKATIIDMVCGSAAMAYQGSVWCEQTLLCPFL